MLRANPEVLSALATLEHDHRFKAVLVWIEESLAECDRKNRTLSVDSIGRGQGEALCLAQILETVAGARAAIAKIKGKA